MCLKTHNNYGVNCVRMFQFDLLPLRFNQYPAVLWPNYYPGSSQSGKFVKKKALRRSKMKLILFFACLILSQSIYFTPEEFNSRKNKILQKIRDADLDAFIVNYSDTILYYTGVSYEQQERPFFIVFFKEEDRLPVLLVPSLEEEHLQDDSALEGVIVSYWEHPGKEGSRWEDGMRVILEELKRIGIEPSMQKDFVDGIEFSIAPGESDSNIDNGEGRFVKAYKFVEQLKMIKSVEEINYIKKSVGYSVGGVEFVFDHLAIHGVTTIALMSGTKPWQDSVSYSELIGGTFDYIQQRLIIGSFPAPHSTKPHAVPPFFARHEGGPHVLIVCLQTSAYWGETERTYFLEPPTEYETNVFNHMLGARQAAYDAIVIGATCSSVDIAARAYLIANGFEDNIIHRTGHGLGTDIHEQPYWIDGNDDCIIQAGMVFSVEPGIYIKGVGGFRHSDTVLMTENGYEILSNFPTDIESLTFV